MPITNQTRNIPLDSINIPRADRQRQDLTFESVTSLALSIGRNHWISDILVDKPSSTIIAGERRCTAVRLLRSALENALSPAYCLNVGKETVAQLTSLASNCPYPWLNWSKIPGKYGHDISSLDRLLFEFIENSERKDLSWQEKARAIYSIHEQGHKDNDIWTAAHTARAANLAPSVTSRLLQTWRAYESGDEKLQAIINESPSAISAIQALERVASRKSAPLTLDPKVPKGLSTQKPGVPEVPGASLTPSSSAPPPIQRLVLNEDFHKFASSYSGTPFNFLHCDFPYGIGFNRSEGQNTAADTKTLGTYDDSADVYWALLHTLVTHALTLLSPSAHIMFWYSQNFERETLDFFAHHLPGAVIQKFKMVWHCSDNSGLMPDTQRYGRRTYETALLLTLGDRKIVQGKALSFSAPRTNTIHRSQKPLDVLLHFFSMFVDDTSHVLDPTCGSATSILAARQLNAASALGLEIDPDTYASAIRHIDQAESQQTLAL